MRLFRLVFAAPIAAFALANPSGTIAQQSDQSIAGFAQLLPERILKQIVRDKDGVLRQMSNTLFQLAPDGVATVEAIRIFRLRNDAHNRSRALSQFLRFDLDGDGQIDKDEIASLSPYLPANQRSELTLAIVENDKDADGELSAQEISAAANNVVSIKNNLRRSDQFEAIMSFDLDQDGQVTLPEIAKVIASVDTSAVASTRSTIRRDNTPAVLCKIPKPADNAEVVFLSGYEGDTLTTLAVSGQNKPTTVGTVTIHSGDKPLYIFATAYSSIVWQFKGDTDRIQQVIVQARAANGNAGAAVAGVPGDKVKFTQIGTCLDGSITKRNAKEDAKIEGLANWLGREFDHIVVNYKIAGFQVPPGVEASVEAFLKRPYENPISFSLGERSYQLTSKGMSVQGTGTPEATHSNAPSMSVPMRSMMRFHPGGILPLEPDEVYSPTKVQHYTVLPQEAGIVQLVAEGSLVPESQNTYRIVKPISHFPSGLAGSHAVRFVLAKGVPMPAGSPGHSSVFSEETGKCLSQLRCK